MMTPVSVFFHSLYGALDALFSAARASGSLERGGVPDPRDLRRLRIDTAEFAVIHRA